MSDSEITQADEEILFPDQPICDPHHHFFEFPDFSYMPDDLMEDISSGHKVVSTVYVDCQTGYRKTGPEEMRPVGETEYLERMISDYGNSRGVKIAAGMVGFADLKMGDGIKPVLEAHLAAGPERFKGIRNVASWDASPAFSGGYNATHPGLLLDPDFRKGFACLEKLGLSFDAMLFHTQLSDLIDLANAFPRTTIILDHIGLPLGKGPYADQREEVFSNWKRGIKSLSECENVFVKIGGFGIEVGIYGLGNRPKPVGSTDLYEIIKPYGLRCIEQFGVERCMFESNFPVDKQLLPYVVIWNSFKLMTKDFSKEERQALFHDTAVKAYRLKA